MVFNELLDVDEKDFAFRKRMGIVIKLLIQL